MPHAVLGSRGPCPGCNDVVGLSDGLIAFHAAEMPIVGTDQVWCRLETQARRSPLEKWIKANN